MVITDIDIDVNDPVDEITIPIPRVDGQPVPTMTYTGICGRASLAAWIRVMCNTGFAGTECQDCAANYYPEGRCDVLCIPMDNENGHYTCDPNTGDRICLSRYTNVNNNCLDCLGNRQEPDCTLCDANFQAPDCNTCVPRRANPSGGCTDCAANFKGPDCSECNDNFVGENCEICAPNYFPPGGCFCTPRNDSGGHFTCDMVTGEKICLDEYVDPDTNCVRTGWRERERERETIFSVIRSYGHRHTSYHFSLLLQHLQGTKMDFWTPLFSMS